jgi:hypothetical protein
MQELGFDWNGAAIGKGRVTPGEPIYWRLQPDWSKPLSSTYLGAGAELEIVAISGDFVGGWAAGLAGWVPRGRVTLPTVVRIYKAGNQENAARAFQIDAARWAQLGYYPTSQSWAQGSYGCGAFLGALLLCVLVIGIVVFLYMLLVKAEGTLTVTYEFRAPQPSMPQERHRDWTPPVPPHSRATKRCPQCAEDVLAEARMCRYCRYEFNPIEESVPDSAAPLDPLGNRLPQSGHRIHLDADQVLRQEPHSSAAIIGGVTNQTEVTVLRSNAGWAWVQSDKGADGWMEWPAEVE